jgi:hypothetical protein
MSRDWARLMLQDIAGADELLNLNAADLIVVVSGAMRDELGRSAWTPDRVLVNPNAVDPARYTPTSTNVISPADCRLGEPTSARFISTFQPGTAPSCSRAFAACSSHVTRLVRLLDDRGGTRRVGGSESASIVRPGQGPSSSPAWWRRRKARYLAAVRRAHPPHVPNADGTPVLRAHQAVQSWRWAGASSPRTSIRLEVLRHGEMAWLAGRRRCPDRRDGRLVRDPALRGALGAAARREALTHHTWHAHVQRTLDALDARVHAGAA